MAALARANCFSRFDLETPSAAAWLAHIQSISAAWVGIKILLSLRLLSSM